MKKVYIAGKVTGEAIAACTLKFGNAQKQLEAMGYKAINPIVVVDGWHTTWKNAMRKCIKALMECDAIYVLPCSENSEGASIEMNLAASLSIPMYVSLTNLKQIDKCKKSISL